MIPKKKPVTALREKNPQIVLLYLRVYFGKTIVTD
jgi:hypothetical protein